MPRSVIVSVFAAMVFLCADKMRQEHREEAAARVVDPHTLVERAEALTRALERSPLGLPPVYWPDDKGGFFWVVESKTAKGWRRFVTHHYHPA